MKNQKSYLMRDLGIIIVSIFVAVLLTRTGVLNELVLSLKDYAVLSSILAGILFISTFTFAISIAILIEIAKIYPFYFVALFASFGALIGDYIIFRFVRDSFSQSILDLFNRPWEKKIISVLKMKAFKILGMLLGAVIIASPLPDEIGIMLMGFSRMNTYIFILLSFILNYFGIFFLLYFFFY